MVEEKTADRLRTLSGQGQGPQEKELPKTPEHFNPKLPSAPVISRFKPNPNVKIYRRPPRKKVTDENIFGLGEGYGSKASGWKQDERVVAVLGKLAAGRTFDNENFSDYVFSGAKLESAVMTRCVFKDCNFFTSNMMKGDFNHSDFTDANLAGANLAGADLSYSDFTGADLTGANLAGANLTGAKIDAIVLSEDTDFGGVVADAGVQRNIDKFVSLQEAAERGDVDLRTLGIVDLRKLDLRSINLKGVYLKDRDLKGRLTGVNLSGAVINESDILGADVNMIHYWMQNTNEYNEYIDNKALKRREDDMQNSVKQVQETIAEEKDFARRIEEKLKGSDVPELPPEKIEAFDKNISQSEQKKGKIIKRASVRVKPVNNKLID